MSTDLGDNLSGYRNLDFLTGSSPEDLRSQLTQIKLPFKVVAMYSQGSNHVAWIVPTQPIKKIMKKGVR